MAGRLLDAAAQAGGVDEAVHHSPDLDQFVDRVDRRPRDIVDHRAGGAGQLVQQRRLADVRAPDDRHPARAADLGLTRPRRLGQGGQHGVQQVAGAASVQGGDRPRLAQAEVPHRHGVGLAAGVVHLVGGQHDRLLGAAQHTHHGLVDVLNADRGVHHEEHSVGGGDGQFGLLGDLGGHADRIRRPAAGVDHHEVAAVPFGVVGDPVTGHAGEVLDDGLAASDDAVDQHRLANVGTPDDGQHRLVEGLLHNLAHRPAIPAIASIVSSRVR